jgi:hypothetical protein
MDALSIVAEVSVGLAGFAGVAVMLGRGPGRWSGGDAARIRLMLGAAFAALFGSLVPIGLVFAGVAEPLALRLGAAVVLLEFVLWSFGASRSIGSLSPEERAVFDPRVARVTQAFMFSSIALLALAAAGLAGPATAGILFLALFLLLGYAAFGFVRLMFVRPEAD